MFREPEGKGAARPPINPRTEKEVVLERCLKFIAPQMSPEVNEDPLDDVFHVFFTRVQGPVPKMGRNEVGRIVQSFHDDRSVEELQIDFDSKDRRDFIERELRVMFQDSNINVFGSDHSGSYTASIHGIDFSIKQIEGRRFRLATNLVDAKTIIESALQKEQHHSDTQRADVFPGTDAQPRSTVSGTDDAGSPHSSTDKPRTFIFPLPNSSSSAGPIASAASATRTRTRSRQHTNRLTKGLIGIVLLGILFIGGAMVLSADDDFYSACQGIERQVNQAIGTTIISDPETGICRSIKSAAMHFKTLSTMSLVGWGDEIPNCNDRDVKQSLMEKLESAGFAKAAAGAGVPIINDADKDKLRSIVTYKLEQIAEREKTDNKRYCVVQIYARIDSENYKHVYGDALAQVYGINQDLEIRKERNFSVQRDEDGSIYILLDD